MTLLSKNNFRMKTLSKRNLFDVLRFRMRRFIYIKLTSKSCNLFFRGGDIISFAGLVEGVHEESLTNLICNFAENGFSDYLIDIGANIGLTSCQNGSLFKNVICFEPNPLCVNILKTNLAISLSNDKFEINEFALGECDGDFELHIPKHNWGGAFVRSESNSYSDQVLASKDGFNEINSKNYVVSTIQVKSTKDTFIEIFSELERQGLKNGVIKIDVEGFERVVLKGIFESLPSDFNLVIVFENWDENFDFDELKDVFTTRNIRLRKIEGSVSGMSHSKIYKLISLVFGRSDNHYLIPLDSANSVAGDIVIEVLQTQ